MLHLHAYLIDYHAGRERHDLLYTSCYSGRTRTYYYNTYEDPAIRAYPLDSVPLDGGAVVKVPATL